MLGPKSARSRSYFQPTAPVPAHCGKGFAELDPRLFSFNSKHGWCESCFGTGVSLAGFSEEHTGEEKGWNEWYEHEAAACGACAGARLNAIALNVRFRGRSIAALAHEPIGAARRFFAALKLNTREAAIARDLMAEIRARLSFLGASWPRLP